ncbi:unnamed protein product [Rotaria magnacalcarata]|uniref:Hepatocyte growth factor-regulated tyrosine kinase substrate n=1 Tax=Rotaria magnacalcarata TaxID=392030 RepID=A0A815IV64_9BILA|nr:unnamed protein product [Rotaria magnacalcarata]
MSLFGISNTKVFDKLFEKATSPLLIEPDWQTILQLCDIVKSQEVPAKYAIQAIKKKFGHENPGVILNSLHCLESIVKNCGGTIHKEVSQRDMIDTLRELTKNGPDVIRDKVLELIQCWSHGLGQQYKIFTDTYNLMKLENYRFPPLKESEVMFENNDIAPEWRDDKECYRCRQVFTTFNRKHHCRACGEIFCDKCSSKQCAIPKYGMDRNVRVCDACYEKLTTGPQLSPRPTLIPKSVTTTSGIAPSRTKTQAEIDEEESFQLALAISQSEAEEKERQKKMLTQKYAMSSFLSAPNTNNNNPPSVTEINNNHHEYAELTKYIEKGRQEQQQRETFSSSNFSNGHELENNTTQLPNELNGFITDNEIDQFTTVVTDNINNFKFRMLSNQQRSRNVTTDTSVQSVFVMLQHFHPELPRFMQLLEDKRTYYENLQDKLNQLKDAREALNALRTEHSERKQQEALERERQRQIQLAQKLDVMRQKKQEYLEYQRQLHLQRLAQQELEMKNRLEQQRQLTLAREQFVQNPQLPLASYDYSRLPQSNLAYQQPYATLPTQPSMDPINQYSVVPSLPPQQSLPPSQYPPMMMYPPKLDANVLTQTPVPQPIIYSMGATGDNNYNHSYGQMSMTNANISYTQSPPPSQQQPQQSTPIINQEKPEPQLIIFD